MNKFERLVVITLLGFASVAGAQINMPSPGAPGTSPETAVRLVSTSDLMVDRQIKRWLKAHYPGWMPIRTNSRRSASNGMPSSTSPRRTTLHGGCTSAS